MKTIHQFNVPDQTDQTDQTDQLDQFNRPGRPGRPDQTDEPDDPDEPVRFELRRHALELWREPEPGRKLARLAAAGAVLDDTQVDAQWRARAADAAPGRPTRPRLVRPRDLPQRPAASLEGRAALLHAIAHIEFNAINLALDAVWRFAELPADFYRDWFGVALDEARHFGLLRDRLAEFGRGYGDFDAHDGLWQMAYKTRGDVLARMALVPGVMEARGLDATPPIQRRLRAAGDQASAEILQVILDEEVRHVAIGRTWFDWLCERAGLSPREQFEQLIERHDAPRPRAPLNVEARLRAGFSAEELRAWQQRPARVPPRAA